MNDEMTNEEKKKEELKAQMFFWKYVFYGLCAKDKSNYFSLDYIINNILWKRQLNNLKKS
jgi:hypothetical protein